MSLRMSEEQHKRLREWAYNAERSMNSEALHRLFGEMKQEQAQEETPGLTFEERMKLAGRR